MKKLLVLLAILVIIGCLMYIFALQPRKVSRTISPENQVETQTFSPNNPGTPIEDIPQNLLN